MALFEHDELIATAPAYIKTNSHGEFVFDHAWAHAYARTGREYYPKLVVAVPYTPVTGPRLLAKDAGAREKLILALQQKRGTNIQIAFQNSKVIVGIPNSVASFEQPFDLMNLNAAAEGLMTELFDVLALVDDLDLNDRLAKAS